jgi:2,3-bisphosphoglycerate-dependent phosphoglycerate mutase
VTNLHLIRHGEAEVNVRRVVGGRRGDTGLTPRGVLQAERLRDRLAATGEICADVLLTSPLPRARQTAEILAPALGLPLVLDDDLQELDPGEADGLPFEEALQRFGLHDFEQEPSRPICPGGESWTGFMARVAGALARLAHTHEDRTVVAVTHGGVIDGSFVHFLGLREASFPGAHFATRHTSLTQWQRRPHGGPAGGWRLMIYNDAMHLADVDRPTRIPWTELGVRPSSRR